MSFSKNLYLSSFLVILCFSWLCYAGFCQKSYTCSDTCFTQHKTSSSTWWSRNTKYISVSKECYKTCYRAVCCEGYIGIFCHIPTCFGSANCPNSGTCSAPDFCSNCKTGFISPNCDDEDECSSNNDDCDHYCTNTYGSYTCSCRSGYTLSSDQVSCIDKNECLLGTANCEYRCTNTRGSYECHCRQGYQLDRNGRTCSDANECSNGASRCQQDCSNTVGSYTCSCREGYTQALDGKSCDDIDECSDGSAGCEHFCQNYNGYFTCVCEAGYDLDADGTSCYDVNECNSANGNCEQICSNNLGSYQCTCNDGYNLHTNGHTCMDIDECGAAVSPCEQICDNTVGSYQCGCQNGFALNSDGISCHDIDDCIGHECLHDGKCVDGLLSYTCECLQGYIGDRCQTDLDECDFLNGGCQSICSNIDGSFVCSCSGNRPLATDGVSCIGESSTAPVFGRYGISRKLLPKGCSTIMLNHCAYDKNISLIFSSTSAWYMSSTDVSLVYTFGIVFAEVGSLSIPISLTGVTIHESDTTFSLEMTTNGYTTNDGTRIGNSRTDDCLSFELTASDVFEFVSANSFFVSFLTNLLPKLPEWIEFAASNHNILKTQDTMTDLVYGRDIEDIKWCQGAPVFSDNLYSIFKFNSGFMLSIYGNTIEIPEPLNGQKFCIIVDICQHTGGTIFIMIPEESKMLFTQLQPFKMLYEEHHLVMWPKGIGLSLVNGINIHREQTQLQLWNGDRPFNYPVFETADIWIDAEISAAVSLFEIETKAEIYMNIPNVNRMLLGMFLDEWNLLATLSTQTSMTIKFDLFGKSRELTFNNFVTTEATTYMSIGATESRELCGDTSNPPGIFGYLSLRINPFQGVPFLEDWLFDNTHTVYAYVTTDPASPVHSDTIIDIANDIIKLDERLERLSDTLKSTLETFGNLLLNETETLLLTIESSFESLGNFVNSYLNEIRNDNLNNIIEFLKEVWSRIIANQVLIDEFVDAIEFNIETVNDTFIEYLNTELNDIKNNTVNAINTVTNQVNTIVEEIKGFGIKYRVTLKFFGLQLIDLDIEFVYATNDLGACSRFDTVYSLLKDERAARIIGRVPKQQSLGRFLILNGVGIGGALALDSDKWIFQITALIDMIGIKTTVDVFISSDKSLRIYMEGHVWGVFLAQIDISAELGEEWYQLRFKLEGRFLAKARRKRQTQTPGESFQDSYLDALKKAVTITSDTADKRLSQVQQGLTTAQNGMSKAQIWLDEKKTDLRNADSYFDRAVDSLEGMKAELEAAKGPFEQAIKTLERAQKNVDNLCKIHTCTPVCIPGLKCKWCRTGGWIKVSYPCCKTTSCMLKVPNILCEAANLICRGVRAFAYLALEAAKIFVRLPIIALDAAKAAVSVAQIIVDKSRVVLDIAEVAIDLAIVGLEGAKFLFEVAKGLVEEVKIVIGIAAQVVELVIEHGLKNILDVRNCGFNIELSTTDLPIFDVSCEVNAFRLGWTEIKLTVNFQNIVQSIWQAAKAAIKEFMNALGNTIGRRKRHAIAFASAAKMHNIIRNIRGFDESNLSSILNNTIDVSSDTQENTAYILTDFDSKVQVFKEKCDSFSTVDAFLKDAFQTLFEIANDSYSGLEAANSLKNELNNNNIQGIIDNISLENSGVSLENAMNDYNLTREEIETVINNSKIDALSNPLLTEIDNSYEFVMGTIDSEVAETDNFSLLTPWINAMDNVTTEYFNQTDCFGFQDCILFSIFTLYDLFTVESHPNLEDIETAISIVEDNIIELISNTSQNISSVYTLSGIIDSNIKLISDLNLFCSTPPTIVEPLANQNVVRGEDITLRCGITAEPVLYWWYKDDTMLDDEQSEVLQVVKATDEHEGMYRCMAGNIFGNLTSQEAFLRVDEVVFMATEEQTDSQVSAILIGSVCGAITVVAIIVAVVAFVYWKQHVRIKARDHFTKSSFASLSMVRPDIAKPVFQGLGNVTYDEIFTITKQPESIVQNKDNPENVDI